MSIAATSIRRGMSIMFQGEPCRVIEFHHHTPGNLRAMVHAKMKKLKTGVTVEHRFRASDTVDTRGACSAIHASCANGAINTGCANCSNRAGRAGLASRAIHARGAVHSGCTHCTGLAGCANRASPARCAYRASLPGSAGRAGLACCASRS